MRLLLCVLLFLCPLATGAPLYFETTREGVCLFARLPAEIAEQLPSGILAQEQGEKLLTLSRMGGEFGNPGPNMLGKYERVGDLISFRPRLSLDAGVSYRARLLAPGVETELEHRTLPHAAKPPPKVSAIYPSADILPANQLRFYLYFDRPMRGGSALFKHIALLDEEGTEIDAPWLDDEIWDEASNCLILYIHPGRIKRGVEMRRLMGPVLKEGRSYALAVRGAWTDLEGNRIGNDVIKKFTTTSEEHARIELGSWSVSTPSVRTHDALVVTLNKPADYRSLQTGKKEIHADGRSVEGSMDVPTGDKACRFKPLQHWRVGKHRIEVSPAFEDVAGNTPERPFDRDLLSEQPQPQFLSIEFEPRRD
jgi:hypothetical protein